MIFDIRDFGAVGDGVTLNTAAIQRAIDACTAAGGGRVLVENGTYLTGPIRLRSYVELHLAANATLLGSPDFDDYHDWEDTEGLEQTHLPRGNGHCLIFAWNCRHISITGQGAIDANGAAFVAKAPIERKAGWKTVYPRLNDAALPRVIFIAGCKKVLLEDMTLQNSPSGWGFFLHNCEDVCVDRITIDTDLRYRNNDGLHINSSRNVRVSDCNIVASDDAIVVRANNYSLRENHVCEGVCVTNCTLVSHCGGVRLGWLRDGTIRNCVFSNLTMLNTRTGILMTFPWRGEARISDEGREKTRIENILFDNIVMDRIFTHPIRLYMDDHPGTHADIDCIRNITFRGIRARGLMWPSLEARPSCQPEHIEFCDCAFSLMEQTAEFGDFTYLPSPPEKTGVRLFANLKDARLNNTILEGM